VAKRVLFSGSIAGHASGYGGNTWAFLQWVLGFRRLGFEVYYVEEFRAKQPPNDQSKSSACHVMTSARLRLMSTCFSTSLVPTPLPCATFAAAFISISIQATPRSGRSSTAST
jgi:hypothetical protein